MNRKRRIESILSNSFKEWKIEILDESHKHVGHHNFDGKQESHIVVVFQNINRKKINRLKLHRKINFLLKDEFLNGLHALEIKIL